MIVVHGVSKLYWGVETDLVDTSVWTRAWLVQDMEPYRRSTHGWRIRLGKRALHFGICRFGEAPHRPLEVEPTDIGQWGKKDVQEEDGTEPAAAVEDGPAEREGSDRRLGDEPQPIV